MSDLKYHVAAVGNALVDVLAHTDDAFLEQQKAAHGMEKGAMTLIGQDRAVELYDLMGPAVESSGGSAANTIAGLASFGGKAGYIGKVADDQLGDIFEHDLRALGVDYRTSRLTNGPKTGRCMILVSPDAQRTMNTFLGASSELDPSDIDADLIAASEVTYLEGYLFDKDAAKNAFVIAAKEAHLAGNRVALTLSDSFCVDRHRHDFLDLVNGHVDLLFANEDEIKALFLQNEFIDAIEAVRNACEIAVVTRGEQGALILSGGHQYEVEAKLVREVVDTTGAGDQFAAGFLYGFTQGFDLEKCGRLGALAAAEVISHMGPRPEMRLADLTNEAA
ncbi:MAG: adenosine kinase [Alphaproteobacteria bacterium]|nr:adenosine kinase [Alphaproteobacteria bacterium]